MTGPWHKTTRASSNVRFASTYPRMVGGTRLTTKATTAPWACSLTHNSIDLVFFVNGIPVASAELKTDFKQSVADAVQQYKTERHPKGEPLLQFGSRALVHFAVSNEEVQMTTKLVGTDTYFLPFNRG